MNKFYLVDGLKVEIVTPALNTDVRFFSQRQLHALAAVNSAARAELRRRAAIVAAK